MNLIVKIMWENNLRFSLLWILLTRTLILGDNLALLSGTLRTYQKSACDDEWMTLRCPTGTSLSIQFAQYHSVPPAAFHLCASSANIDSNLVDIVPNVTCLWPTAIQAVVGMCQKKAGCKFQTSRRTFGGDPCPGSRKYAEVSYICRPSEFRSLIGCENDALQLKCNKSSRLAIYSASFGRTEYESVQCPQPKGVPEESCLSNYTEKVMQLCHGKRICVLGADASIFGNPCKPESRKYLKVISTCVPRKVLEEKYQGELEPDEMFEDENEDDEEEITDSFTGVIEQPSIYSPNHSKSWTNLKPTAKPHQTSFRQSAGNFEKLYLYVAVGSTCTLLIVALLIVMKFGIQRRRLRQSSSLLGANTTEGAETTFIKPSTLLSATTDPLTPCNDDMNFVSEPCYDTTIDFHSIFYHSTQPHEQIFQLTTSTGESEVTNVDGNRDVICLPSTNRIEV